MKHETKKGAKKRPPLFNSACSHLFLLVGLTRCTEHSRSVGQFA